MRIITGSAKGLKLKTPAGFNTRPTADRVKESLFNILSNILDFCDIENVLDIFAGTGALALESLSRGASSAIFIDSSTADIISENVQRAKFKNVCKVFRADYVKILKKLSAQNMKFDLIFSDPPYNKNLLQNSMNLVAKLNLLKVGGLFIAEYSTDEKIILPENFESVRKMIYGHTTEIEILTLRGA